MRLSMIALLFLSCCASVQAAEGFATPYELWRGDMVKLKDVTVFITGEAHVELKPDGTMIRFKNADGKNLVVAFAPKTKDGPSLEAGKQTVSVRGRIAGRSLGGVSLTDATLARAEDRPLRSLDEAIKQAEIDAKAAKQLAAAQAETAEKVEKAKAILALRGKGLRDAREAYQQLIKKTPTSKITEKQFVAVALLACYERLRKEGKISEEQIKKLVAHLYDGYLDLKD